MKTLFITAILSLLCFGINAQTLKVKNNSNCTVNYYLAATDAACSAGASTVSYSIAPGATAVYTFSTASWSGTVPGSGWQWQFIKEWNGCGTYDFSYPDCVGGVNANVCGVGIACSGLTTTSCMKMDMTCNTCQAVKTEWLPGSGGDVLVNIW